MSEMVKKCLACGLENRIDANKCSQCGSKLLAETNRDLSKIDPMEDAISKTTANAGIEVEEILRSNMKAAKEIVSKEMTSQSKTTQQTNISKSSFAVADEKMSIRHSGTSRLKVSGVENVNPEEHLDGIIDGIGCSEPKRISIPKKKSKMWIVFLVIFLLLAVGTTYWYFFMK